MCNDVCDSDSRALLAVLYLYFIVNSLDMQTCTLLICLTCGRVQYAVWVWQRAFREGYLKHFWEALDKPISEKGSDDEKPTKDANVNAVVQGALEV
jgi:hypothetical protein